MSKENRELAEAAADFVPGFRSELGTRLSSLLDLYGTKVDAAKVAGVTAQQLATYVSGGAKPSFEVLIRLAAPKAVSLDWLATGQGEMRKGPPEPPPPLNRALLVDVIREVEAFLADREATLAPAPKARLIAAFYKVGLDTGGRLASDTLHELFGLAQPKD